ncbi:peptide N-acetyl-beta-D-glucosaminyl asparaginase amidase A-domain-containing protein [Sphaerosporella brunnea]|uniref:Peptide N-acetyl-beta-D-glucosaminyl asparaginase amidase A-domain-containing protein n=1 Tax=Sphaerosporella brunnea TaxID=1250544 RepID=A0A5J5F0A5_9PEZI|nr:peptide N-acetyl-beta-D-glucosaminyl asparaginase amidase A-domain-containing protein [Sphaerosporella brunnea]
MKSIKYSVLPSAGQPRKPKTKLYPLYLLLALFGGFSFYLFAPSSIRDGVSEAQPGLSPRQINILREACNLRFWKRRVLSYCQEPAWIIPEVTEADRAPLRVFEVYTPPRASPQSLAGSAEEQAAMGAKGKECQQVLMEHTFGFSYGQPFVGEYIPPTDCEWTNVLFNLTVTSKGRQYDRLGLLFLGDIEVWRTSTAEPTSYGIVFSYVKDMTHLTSLLRRPQKIIFDLGNLVNDVYTGSFKATLTATFYSPHPISPSKPADIILPISAQRSSQNQPSHFSLPEDRAIVSPKLPPNTIRAVVSITATGNADEEFWYTNVPTEYTSTFLDSAGILPGYGPFRELQVLIDSRPAGYIFPEITVFTGGIVPTLWRPIVAPGTYNLPEYEVDISPFLPILLDGAGNHTIELVVNSYDTTTHSISTAIGTDWLVSGRVHIWTDPSPSWRTTGTLHLYNTPTITATITPSLTTENGVNTSLSLTFSAARNLAVATTLQTSQGKQTAAWTQSLQWSAMTYFSSGGNRQLVSISISGSESTSYDSRSWSQDPFVLDTVYIPATDYFTIDANLRMGMQNSGIKSFSEPTTTGKLRTRLSAQASWRSDQGGNGTTSQVWGELRTLENDEGVASYGRAVEAVDGAVKEDWERINGAASGAWTQGREMVEELLGA